jgi:hypothetical protein
VIVAGRGGNAVGVAAAVGVRAGRGREDPRTWTPPGRRNRRDGRRRSKTGAHTEINLRPVVHGELDASAVDRRGMKRWMREGQATRQRARVAAVKSLKRRGDL